MGTRGPTPAPVALRTARGNRNKGAVKAAADPGAWSAPPARPPASLGKIGRARWRSEVRLQSTLAERGIAWITASDYVALEVYCIAYERWRESVNALNRSISEVKRRYYNRVKSEGGSEEQAAEAARQATGTLLQTDSRGGLEESPFVLAELRQRKAMLAAASKVCLVPSARARMQADHGAALRNEPGDSSASLLA